MALEQFDEGKCINCGFLGQREHRSTMSVCYEASVSNRLRGDLTVCGGVTTYAWCFVRKLSIGDEVQKIGGSHVTYDKVLEVLKYDRHCPNWCQWTEFVSPKEHYEELNMRQLELDRQKFEQRIEDDRRKFELELQKSSERDRKRTDGIMIGLAIVGIILALAQVFTITADAIIFKWF